MDAPMIGRPYISLGDAEHLADARLNPFPKTLAEFAKQMNDGAVEAKNFYRDAAVKIYKDFFPPAPPAVIIQGAKRPLWFLPFMINGDSKTEEKEQ